MKKTIVSMEELQLRVENLNLQLQVLQQRYEIIQKIELPNAMKELNDLIAKEKEAAEEVEKDK